MRAYFALLVASLCFTLPIAEGGKMMAPPGVACVSGGSWSRLGISDVETSVSGVYACAEMCKSKGFSHFGLECPRDLGYTHCQCQDGSNLGYTLGYTHCGSGCHGPWTVVDACGVVYLMGGASKGSVYLVDEVANDDCNLQKMTYTYTPSESPWGTNAVQPWHGGCYSDGRCFSHMNDGKIVSNDWLVGPGVNADNTKDRMWVVLDLGSDIKNCLKKVYVWNSAEYDDGKRAIRNMDLLSSSSENGPWTPLIDNGVVNSDGVYVGLGGAPLPTIFEISKCEVVRYVKFIGKNVKSDQYAGISELEF